MKTKIVFLSVIMLLECTLLGFLAAKSVVRFSFYREYSEAVTLAEDIVFADDTGKSISLPEGTQGAFMAGFNDFNGLNNCVLLQDGEGNKYRLTVLKDNEKAPAKGSYIRFSQLSMAQTLLWEYENIGKTNTRANVLMIFGTAIGLVLAGALTFFFFRAYKDSPDGRSEGLIIKVMLVIDIILLVLIAFDIIFFLNIMSTHTRSAFFPERGPAFLNGKAI